MSIPDDFYTSMPDRIELGLSCEFVAYWDRGNIVDELKVYVDQNAVPVKSSAGIYHRV